MQEVYPLWRLVVLLVRESSRHVGAAATSAALRDALDGERLITLDQFDRSFAVSRLTPGTNLIALYAALGGLVAGPSGAVVAVVIGLLPAVLVTLAVCAAYLHVGDTPALSRAMSTASAAAWAVLIWSAGRFLSGPARSQWFATLVLTFAAVALALFGVPVVAVLVMSAAFGALVFGPRTQ